VFLGDLLGRGAFREGDGHPDGIFRELIGIRAFVGGGIGGLILKIVPGEKNKNL